MEGTSPQRRQFSEVCENGNRMKNLLRPKKITERQDSGCVCVCVRAQREGTGEGAFPKRLCNLHNENMGPFVQKSIQKLTMATAEH